MMSQPHSLTGITGSDDPNQPSQTEQLHATQKQRWQLTEETETGQQNRAMMEKNLLWKLAMDRSPERHADEKHTDESHSACRRQKITIKWKRKRSRRSLEAQRTMTRRAGLTPN